MADFSSSSGASSATIEVGGHTLTLLPEKAVWLAAHHTLLVADAHIGKAVTFRGLGVPVPRGTTSETLSVLTQLLARWPAQRIVFLGDFLHSARVHASATLAVVSRWREAHAGIDLTLVRGNHDDRAGDPPAALRIEAVDEPLRLDGLRLCHHPRRPAPHDDGYVIAGHLHPCFTLGGRANDRLRLPCFHFGPRVGVLPAFGAFTGMHAADVQPGDEVFVVAQDRVAQVPR